MHSARASNQFPRWFKSCSHFGNQSRPFLSDNEAPPKPIPPKALAPPRFAQLKTDADVRKTKQAAVCDKTQQDTKWCVNIWNLWREQRNPSDGIPPVIDAQNLEVLPQWLSRFILEVCKHTGDPYPPETLYHIVCWLVRHIRCRFFNDKIFAECQTILDSEWNDLEKLEYKQRASKQNLCHWTRKSYCGKEETSWRPLPRCSAKCSLLPNQYQFCPQKWCRTQSSQTRGKLPDRCSRANWTASLFTLYGRLLQVQCIIKVV